MRQSQHPFSVVCKRPLRHEPHGSRVVVFPHDTTAALHGLFHETDFEPGC